MKNEIIAGVIAVASFAAGWLLRDSQHAFHEARRLRKSTALPEPPKGARSSKVEPVVREEPMPKADVYDLLTRLGWSLHEPTSETGDVSVWTFPETSGLVISHEDPTSNLYLVDEVLVKHFENLFGKDSVTYLGIRPTVGHWPDKRLTESDTFIARRKCKAMFRYLYGSGALEWRNSR